MGSLLLLGCLHKEMMTLREPGDPCKVFLITTIARMPLKIVFLKNGLFTAFSATNIFGKKFSTLDLT